MTSREKKFQTLLRARACKATPARVAVLKLLDRTRRPLSVQDIVRRLGEQKIACDQATIYRTLQLLGRIGLIRQIDFQHDQAYFELSASDDHHHAVCLKCHRVADVDACTDTNLQNIALKQSGFAEITQHSLEFFGICQQCKE